MRAAGSPPHFQQILANEFTAAAACCPILLTKDIEDGHFFPGAMFGFKTGENLVGGVDERGGFDPLILQRQGFFISGQQIAIDPGHARFSDSDGDPMFDETGAPAAALRNVQRVLGGIRSGIEQTQAFIAALGALKLIEPLVITLAFVDGEKLNLQGLYTVSQDRLRELDDAAALRLFRAGHLQLAYAMAGSLRHLGRLAWLRDHRS